MELDIEAERRMQPGHEGLDAMCLREGADAWEQSFEPVLVFSKVPVGLQAIGSPSGLAA